MHLSAGEVVERAFEHHFLDLREVVGEDFALQVVVFVLDDTRQNAVDVAVVVFAVLIVVSDVDVGFSDDILVDFGQTEAALCEGDVIAEAVSDGRVYECTLERLVVGIDFLLGGGLDHEYADGFAHLRGGEPNTVGLVHRLEKVGDETLQRFVFQINFHSCFPQHRLTVQINR